MANYRRAHSLATLLDQINDAAPQRKKTSDGWIGDLAHASRKSDHNPNSRGVVQAIDITHDIENLADGDVIDLDDFHSWKAADMILAKQDPRLKYIISHKRIGSGPSGTQPGKWRKYTGANAHSHHVHISVEDDADLYDDKRPWDLDFTLEPREPPPKVPPPPGITDETKRAMMEWVLKAEGRFTSGRIQVHTTSDGPEIGGIVKSKHPNIYADLERKLRAGDDAGVRQGVINFYLMYSKPAFGWHEDAGVAFYLADSLINRGPTGAAMILQMAVGFAYPKDLKNPRDGEADGQIGPTTRDRINTHTSQEMLILLRDARERYEDARYGARPKLREGLENRWDNALEYAQSMQEQGQALAHGTRWLQESLNRITLGSDLEPLDVDGSLGDKTRTRLRMYQEEKGLTPDGLPDPETFAAIEASLATLVPAQPGQPGGDVPGGAAPSAPDVPQPAPAAEDQRLASEVLDVFRGWFGRS